VILSAIFLKYAAPPQPEEEEMLEEEFYDLDDEEYDSEILEDTDPAAPARLHFVTANSNSIDIDEEHVGRQDDDHLLYISCFQDSRKIPFFTLHVRRHLTSSVDIT
jgi:hypothetical protein